MPCAVTAKFEALAMMTGVVSLVARSEHAAPSIPLAGADLASLPHRAAAFGRPVAPPPDGDLLDRVLRVLLTGLLEVGPPR